MAEQYLCDFNDVAEEDSKEFFIELNGQEQSILAVKKDGIFNVFVNKCPHIGVPMNLEPDRFLDSEKNFIMCSTHGALFKMDDGECVHGPCLGQHLTPVPFHLQGQEVFIAKDL
ncbi:MAG: Rieske 2Fe-2S domain-containing protein [Methylocystaceae bacterium]|jgi:nitrite reductase/ring-hydroxylating ferredoxin subunit|nr:Rieske 2Fe-2S domain-containing protein [Methylocystaceae bacterium]